MSTSAPTTAAKALIWLLAMLLPVQSSLTQACGCDLSVRAFAKQAESSSSGHVEVKNSRKCSCCPRSNKSDLPTKSDSDPAKRKPCGCPEGCICQADPMPQHTQRTVEIRSSECLVARIAPSALLLPKTNIDRVGAALVHTCDLSTTLQRCSQLCRFVV